MHTHTIVSIHIYRHNFAGNGAATARISLLTGHLQVDLHMSDEALKVLEGTHHLVFDELPRIALLMKVLVLRELADDVHRVGHTLLGHLRLSIELRLLLIQWDLDDTWQLVLVVDVAVHLLPVQAAPCWRCV